MPIPLELVLTIVVAIISSNALWGFLQFKLERKDKKSDCSKKILEKIEEINKKIDVLQEEVETRTIIEKRIRILKFIDETIEGWKHSKDSYDQIMEDITQYEKYCTQHPNFKNNKTQASINHIVHNYSQHLRKNDFWVDPDDNVGD